MARSALGEVFLGQPERMQQVPLGYKPYQEQGMEQLMNRGMQGLENPYAGFEPLQQETMRQFNQETMPSIMSRIGSLGGGHSSAYGQAGTQAGQDLMTRLNAQKAQWGQGNIQNYMNMINQGLTRQNETFFRPRQSGLLEGVGTKLLSNMMSNPLEELGKMWGGGGTTGGTSGATGGAAGANPYAKMGWMGKLGLMGLGG